MEHMQEMTHNKKKSGLFTKDFTLVVMGQIISLFGNAVLRFALPYYILDQSSSAVLFALVSASSIIPMILMSPIGGIIADRVNKQRIMVALDFFTCALILGFLFLWGKVSLIPLMLAALMLLYGIQGAYTPAVQASLPVLAGGENLVPANAVVNLVQSFSSLLGPVIGGMLYGIYGLTPILVVGASCFFFSAVMELFIHIPHQPRAMEGSVWSIVKGDMKDSFQFVLSEKPILSKVVVLIFSFNLFLSSLIVIGFPVIITQYLGMSSQLYGFSQGAMAAGGLAGGLITGLLGKKMDVRNSWVLLVICAAGILPIGLLTLPGIPAMAAYLGITILSFLLMAGATIFSIQMLAFVQAETPTEIVGKVIALLMALSVCAQPIGQTIYGFLFDRFGDTPWYVVLGACAISLAISLYSKRAFRQL